MKEIIHEFGTTILAIISGMLLMGVLFTVTMSDNIGILELLGESTKREMITYQEYNDYQAVIEWHNRSVPQVTYTDRFGRFFAGESTDLLARFEVMDGGGRLYPMKELVLGHCQSEITGSLMEIQTLAGSSVKDSYLLQQDRMQFLEPGVYMIYFTVKDQENRRAIWKIPMAVDVGR